VRRQTNPQGLAARWPVRPLDIDPFRLPAQFSLPVQSVTGKLLRARDRIRIEVRTIAVEREMLGARAIVKAIALEEFSGVAIRADVVGDNEDTFVVSVNLHHADPELCIPLHMSFDMSEVSARWQSWGRALRLPLLLPALDGTWREPVERLGKVTVSPPCSRDPRHALAARRSCISSLREVGDHRTMPVFAGAEIIARH
jgi:hypothetical protein